MSGAAGEGGLQGSNSGTYFQPFSRHYFGEGDTKREKLTVRLSYDEGATWPVAKLLHAGPSAYSALVVLRDGTAGCLYEGGERSPYERITFARLSLEWLTDGKDRLKAKWANLGSPLAEELVEHPAATDVRPRPAAVGQDVRIRAAGLLQRIGEARHILEPAVLIHRAGEGDHRRGTPGGINGARAEWVADNLANQLRPRATEFES